MGCAGSLSAKYLPAPKVEEGTSQASNSPQAEKPSEPAQGPKKWTRTEMGQFTVPQLVRWLESLNVDLTNAISGERARKTLWEEIEKSRPPALEQVTNPADLEYWPLPEMLRWLEYFDALDDKVAPKDKLIAMLLDYAEELPPPNFGENAEATFLTEVQRHVTMVKQAAMTIIQQLSEQITEADALERDKHPWYANGKALTDFKPSELKGAEEMNIPFIELTPGDEVDLTLHESSGWAWVVLKEKSGWVPASAVTETAVALQDYGAEEDESMHCIEGDHFEVIMRHYSGWTLCRRPKGATGEGTPSKDVEGWLPDNCLSDHPRNLATKQQHLILSGLQRLVTDLSVVEVTLRRIQTEGAAEDDSLQSLHAKVCGLAEEYRQIVAVLQSNPQLLGQLEEQTESSGAAPEEAIPGLPSWVRVEKRCYYVSQTQKKLMRVIIKRVCEIRRQILVTFISDSNARKIVDFDAFDNMATCPLQPKGGRVKGRKRHAKNATESAQDELAQDLRCLMEALGPSHNLLEDVSENSENSDSESSYSEYTESTTSGGFDRHASARSGEQVSGSTSIGFGAAEGSGDGEDNRREKAARQIQAAYRRFQRTVTFSGAHPKDSRGSSKELSKPPVAPLSPQRQSGAICLVQGVLRGYLAKAYLEALRVEAIEMTEVAVAARRHAAAVTIVSVVKRFQVQTDMLAWTAVCRSVQVWQGAFRTAQARSSLHARRLQVQEAQEASAVKIQTAQRAHSARRELARRKAKRDGLLLLSPGKHRAIRQMQRFGRRYLAWCTLNQAEAMRWASATHLQAHWRGHRCRQQTAEEMQKWRQTRHQAASRLQSMVRAVDAKKQFREGTLMRSAAAQWIQTCWRRHRALQRCNDLRQTQRAQRATLKLQSHWRAHVSRKSTGPQLRRRQLAASRVQGLRRMVVAQAELKRLRAERKQKVLNVSVKMQSLARMHLVKKKVAPKILARRAKVIRLQCFVRKIWAWRQLQSLRHERASVKVQSCWRRQLAKGEAMKRRAQDVDQLLSSLLEGRPDETLRGDTWLQKVTAAFEWKAQRDLELEEKELRLRRQSAMAKWPTMTVEELTRPEGLLAAAMLDRSMAAVCLAKQRARQRMKALLQTQAHGNKGLEKLHYDKQICRSLAVDHGVLIRLNAEDGVAEVGNLLQTAWSIAFQLRNASAVGGASPALQVLTSGVHSLKRKLRIEIQLAGKVSSAEEAAALKGLNAAAEEACDEAVRRATEAREITLKPLKEDLQKAISESQATLKELNSHISKVRPEVDTVKAKYKEEAAQAEAKLREERETKHAQTVALNKIAIGTQIEKERLEVGLADKNKPKIACYKKVFANVKELQQELKDLELSGTANRKSQGILQHTLRALESRAVKAENDSKGRVLFGDAEEDLKDFQPSDKVEKKQERGEEQELQFREALESEVQSLHVDMDARANFEAGTVAAQLRVEAEVCGEAATRAVERLKAWRGAADPARTWLAEVVPIARSCAQIRAAADFIKVCKTDSEASFPLGAVLRAVQKQLTTLETQAANASAEAESPREGQLPQVLQKLQTALKALAELKAAFPDMPRSPHRNSPAAAMTRRLYGRDDDADPDSEAADAEPEERSRNSSVAGAPPPFPPPEAEEDASKPSKSPVRRSSTSQAKNLSIAGLAQLGKNLSALNALQPPVLPGARPTSASTSPQGGKAVAERSDKVTAPLRSPVRPSSASGPARSPATTVPRPAPGTSGSALKAVQKARAVASGWE